MSVIIALSRNTCFGFAFVWPVTRFLSY